MSNVVELRRKDDEPLIWTCECGCTTYRVYSTGALECASCEAIASVSSGEWIKELPEPPASPREDAPESKVIALVGTPAQALATMLKKVNPDEAVAVVVILENGRVRTWGGVDDTERVDWLDQRLDEARELLTMLVKDEAS